MYQNLIRKELKESLKILEEFIKDEHCIHSIENAAKLISNAFKIGRKMITCGNGGSHCDAMHFAEELVGRYRENRPSYPAISISDTSYLTCVSNDFGYKKVFSRYIEAVGKQGDILVGISTSGNSENVIDSIRMARKKGMKVILFTGKDGGKMSGSADVEIRIPYFGYSDRIQEMHIKIIHIITFLIEKEVILSQ